MFGLPTEDDGSRDDPLLGQNMPSLPRLPARLRRPPRGARPGSSSASARSPGRRWPAARRRPWPSGWALAPVIFPGGHDGFLGGEYGGMGKPDAFAATLRTVLAGA